MKKQSTLNKGLATVLALSLGATLSTYGATAALWRAEETIEMGTLSTGHLQMDAVTWQGSVEGSTAQPSSTSAVAVTGAAGKQITFKTASPIIIYLSGTNLEAELLITAEDNSNATGDDGGFNCNVTDSNRNNRGSLGTAFTVSNGDNISVICRAIFSGDNTNQIISKTLTYQLYQVVS